MIIFSEIVPRLFFLNIADGNFSCKFIHTFNTYTALSILYDRKNFNSVMLKHSTLKKTFIIYFTPRKKKLLPWLLSEYLKRENKKKFFALNGIGKKISLTEIFVNENREYILNSENC